MLNFFLRPDRHTSAYSQLKKRSSLTWWVGTKLIPCSKNSFGGYYTNRICGEDDICSLVSVDRRRDGILQDPGGIRIGLRFSAKDFRPGRWWEKFFDPCIIWWSSRRTEIRGLRPFLLVDRGLRAWMISRMVSPSKEELWDASGNAVETVLDLWNKIVRYGRTAVRVRTNQDWRDYSRRYTTHVTHRVSYREME